MHAYIHLFFRFPSHLGHHKSLSSVPCAVQQVLISYLVYTWSYGHVWGLPGGTRGKELTCQCRRCGFYPWVKKIPWRRKWQPIPVFLPGKFHRQRSLAGYNPWGHNRVRLNLATKRQHMDTTIGMNNKYQSTDLPILPIFRKLA